MQLYGGLIQLPDAQSLPVPAEPRIPLGFLSATWAHVSIVESLSGSRPADIVASVLPPELWDASITLRVHASDNKGKIKSALQLVKDCNVALAETATIIDGTDTSDEGREHQITLVIEPQRSNSITYEMLSKRFKDNGWVVDRRSGVFRPAGLVRWTRLCRIESKLFGSQHSDVFAINEDWKNYLQEQDAAVRTVPVKAHAKPIDWSLYDLSAACVSADIDGRFLRYTFAKKGAISLEVEHADTPGVLLSITEAIEKSDGSILLSLLRRGGARVNHATFLAIVEPSTPQNAPDLKHQLEKQIQLLSRSQVFARVSRPKIGEPRRTKLLRFVSAPTNAKQSIDKASTSVNEREVRKRAMSQSLKGIADIQTEELLKGSRPEQMRVAVFCTRDDHLRGNTTSAIADCIISTGNFPMVYSQNMPIEKDVFLLICASIADAVVIQASVADIDRSLALSNTYSYFLGLSEANAMPRLFIIDKAPYRITPIHYHNREGLKIVLVDSFEQDWKEPASIARTGIHNWIHSLT